MMAEMPLADAKRVILHGDFAPWNLLYQNGSLTGILDFESSHLNFRVADFALSWRGYQDDVVLGYEEVSPLSEDERRLIVPIFWAWLFNGVEQAMRQSRKDGSKLPDLQWETRHLLMRTTLHNGVPPYPGRA